MSLVLSGNSGSLTVDSSNGITFPNSTVQASAGKIIQVVSATSTTTYSSSSTSWVAATGFSATISPQFSTSKIAVFMCGGTVDSNGIGSQVAMTIYRNNTTNLAPPNGGNDKGICEIYGPSSRLQIPISMSYVDSPSTTSATTYTLYYRGNGSTNYINGDNTQGCIILMEIAQ